MKRILLIDDDIEILSINQKYLTNQGFYVSTISNAKEAVPFIKQFNPNCILLDVMMPQINGFDLCRQIRSFSTCPIIFLTGKGSEDDRVSGLEIGADDYIVKPYSLPELKARIDVIMRRFDQFTMSSPDHNILKFQNLTINRITHKAYYKDTDLLLANREYEVLLYFSTHPNKEITFEALGTALFGSYQEQDRRSVMVNVSRLRKKFEDYDELKNMIETVWSKGYRFLVKQR